MHGNTKNLHATNYLYNCLSCIKINMKSTSSCKCVIWYICDSGAPTTELESTPASDGHVCVLSVLVFCQYALHRVLFVFLKDQYLWGNTLKEEGSNGVSGHCLDTEHHLVEVLVGSKQFIEPTTFVKGQRATIAQSQPEVISSEKRQRAIVYHRQHVRAVFGCADTTLSVTWSMCTAERWGWTRVRFGKQ